MPGARGRRPHIPQRRHTWPVDLLGNGTLVGGRRIEGLVELAGGDVIRIGPEEIVFLGPGRAGSTLTDPH